MVKKVHTIDVGDIPPHEVDAYMEKMINSMKKIPYNAVNAEELERLGYIKLHRPTLWQRIKRLFLCVRESL